MSLTNATVQTAISALIALEIVIQERARMDIVDDPDESIAEINAALAELESYADEWETIPFGAYRTEAETVVLAPNDSDEYPLYLAIRDEFGEGASCGLPAHWRIQRRVAPVG